MESVRGQSAIKYERREPKMRSMASCILYVYSPCRRPTRSSWQTFVSLQQFKHKYSIDVSKKVGLFAFTWYCCDNIGLAEVEKAFSTLQKNTPFWSVWLLPCVTVSTMYDGRLLSSASKTQILLPNTSPIARSQQHLCWIRVISHSSSRFSSLYAIAKLHDDPIEQINFRHLPLADKLLWSDTFHFPIHSAHRFTRLYGSMLTSHYLLLNIYSTLCVVITFNKFSKMSLLIYIYLPY